MSKKIVKVSIPNEIYVNFLVTGTVIDRPGLPLLKILDATPFNEEKVIIAIEVSPYSRGNIKNNKDKT